MKRKASKTTLTRKLDKAWADRIKSVGRCDRCGSTQNLQAAHIVSRRVRTLRWSLRNGLALCASCHWRAHHRPLEFAEFVRGLRPDDYQYLLTAANEISHFTVADYEDLLADLKGELVSESEGMAEEEAA